MRMESRSLQSISSRERNVLILYSKKGLHPEGVYVRQGYSSVLATNTAIHRMIKETDGDHFEDMRSLNQELTFEPAYPS